MANIKFSQFTNQAAADTTYLVGYDGTDNTNYTKAQIKTWLTTGSNAIPTLYSADGDLTSARTITMDGNTLSMAQASGNTVTFSGSNNSGMAITGGNNYIVSFNGTYAISSIATNTSDAIVLRTSAAVGADTSILIDSRSPGANADLHLKTATKLKIDLPVAATVGYVLKADDIAGNVSWAAETDNNTTYDLTAPSVGTLRLTGSDSTTDDVSISGGTGINITQNAANNINIVNSAPNQATPAANDGSPSTGQLQYNDGSNGFAATSDMVYTTDQLKVQNTLYLDGNNANAGIVKLGCEAAGASHYVGLEGPTHGGANAYIIKFPDATPTANQILKVNTVVSSTANMIWAADTDTNTNIANTDLTLGASRTLGLGADQNLTFTGSGTSKVTFSNLGGVEIARDLTVQKNVIIQGQGYSELHTGVTTATFDWNSGNVQSTTLGAGTVAFAPTNPKAGATYIISIAQTGTAVINWSTYVKWPSTGEPTLSGNAKTDVVTLICYDDSTTNGLYYGSATLGFTS